MFYKKNKKKKKDFREGQLEEYISDFSRSCLGGTDLNKMKKPD